MERILQNTCELQRVYLINGPSSSGKTTLCKAFLAKLDTDYIYLSLDNHIKSILDLYDTCHPSLFTSDSVFPVLIPNIVITFHDLINAFLVCNKNVIVDHILEENEWKTDLFKKLEGYSTCKIGLFCSKEELERREIQRGDRQIGSAISQINRVHENIEYDIEIDTHKTKVIECIDRIINYKI